MAGVVFRCEICKKVKREDNNCYGCYDLITNKCYECMKDEEHVCDRACALCSSLTYCNRCYEGGDYGSGIVCTVCERAYCSYFNMGGDKCRKCTEKSDKELSSVKSLNKLNLE